MAFEGLTGRLQGVFSKLRGKGVLNEQDIEAAMREVRLALLEADVNYAVVKDFVAELKEKALGQEILKSLTPGQQVIKLVNEELTELMGGKISPLQFATKGPTIILLIGLQGAGKTTHAAKLAHYLQKMNKHPLMIAADVYRPAAIKQLQILGEQLGVPVFSIEGSQEPTKIVKAGIKQAEKESNDVIIIDTAGRLHIDEQLMAELHEIKTIAAPTEILLVIDAMTGQDAVNIAKSFNKQLSITGLILTKLDGDTRGGAAISAKAVTGSPIKFVGMGEKIEQLEPFYPDRMASRILGMGDVLSLIEKAQYTVDAEQAQAMERKLRKAEINLDDYLQQLEQLKGMGPLDEILAMMPGVSKSKNLRNFKVDEKLLVKTKAIIQSMTIEEKNDPSILNASRRQRIASGSGTTTQDVNRMLKQFDEMKKMVKQFSSNTKKGRSKKGFGSFPFM